MRKTRSWKHVNKTRKQWGTAKVDKRNTPFMADVDAVGYDNTDDGIDEEV